MKTSVQFRPAPRFPHIPQGLGKLLAVYLDRFFPAAPTTVDVLIIDKRQGNAQRHNQAWLSATQDLASRQIRILAQIDSRNSCYEVIMYVPDGLVTEALHDRMVAANGGGKVVKASKSLVELKADLAEFEKGIGPKNDRVKEIETRRAAIEAEIERLTKELKTKVTALQKEDGVLATEAGTVTLELEGVDRQRRALSDEIKRLETHEKSTDTVAEALALSGLDMTPEVLAAIMRRAEEIKKSLG